MRNFKTRASDWQKVNDNKVVSREAAAAIGRAEISAAASRLRIINFLNSVGLRPRLRAAIASRFRKGATSILALRAGEVTTLTAEGLTSLSLREFDLRPFDFRSC
jgi:hypothetical protein